MLTVIVNSGAVLKLGDSFSLALAGHSDKGYWERQSIGKESR